MRLKLAVVALLALHGVSVAAAPRLPGELEAGIGAIVIRLPAYRGSDDSKVRYLPVPYIFYRLNRIEVSGGGVRAQLFASDRVKLSLSMSADLSSNEDENGIRRGMPKLVPTFGAGPSLDLQLWNDLAGSSGRLRLPVRIIAATDFSDFDYVGWLFNPHLRMDRGFKWRDWTVALRGTAGPLWATREYHDYFYAVDPVFATPQRPAYEPGGGYSGLRLTGGVSVGRERWRYGFFATYDYLAGVAFDDSPLFRNEHAAGVGAVITYRFWPRAGEFRKEEGE